MVAPSKSQKEILFLFSNHMDILILWWCLITYEKCRGNTHFLAHILCLKCYMLLLLILAQPWGIDGARSSSSDEFRFFESYNTHIDLQRAHWTIIPRITYIPRRNYILSQINFLQTRWNTTQFQLSWVSLSNTWTTTMRYEVGIHSSRLIPSNFTSIQWRIAKLLFWYTNSSRLQCEENYHNMWLMIQAYNVATFRFWTSLCKWLMNEEETNEHVVQSKMNVTI